MDTTLNLSLLEGSMNGLKHACLTPVIKNLSLDSEQFKNFRPVSNLQFIGKLIERVVFRRLSNHLKRNDLNVSNQYGYKKGHSCETLLLKLINDILKGFESNFATVLLLLDLSAAFDTVNINKLLDILRNEIGICGIACDWFSSFLRDKTMSIKINNSNSEVHYLYSGVAQGSVLGPALFNIYIRPFYTLIENEGFEIKGFADDHQIYALFAPSFEHHYSVTKLNNIFSIVNIWTSKYFLKLNPRKSQIIIFCTETLKRQLNIKGFFLNNTCIRFCNTVSNLGFILDSHLNFELQVNNCVQRRSSRPPNPPIGGGPGQLWGPKLV